MSLRDLKDAFEGRPRRRRRKRRGGRRARPRREQGRFPRREPPPRVQERQRRAGDRHHASWDDEPRLEPAPGWPDDEPEVLDAEWEDVELEGTRGRRGSRAREWGPSVRLGRYLRIRAAKGHRAAVVELRPGLFLVAELPEEVTRTEFGVAPLLAPLIVTAAKKAIEKGGRGKDEAPKAEPGGALRLFRARPAAPERPLLPGPVSSPGAAPETLLLPAPNLGWADDEDVATVLGCECDRRMR